MSQSERNELKTIIEAMTIEEQCVVASCLPDWVLLNEITGRLNRYRDLKKAIVDLNVGSAN